MWLFLAVFITAYIYHGAGITLGYHRLLSHRAYKVPKLVEYFIVLGGYLCLEGSPIFWVTTHRLHHRYSDKPGDPHSPVDGLWHAFLGWMYKPKVHISLEESRTLAPDLWRDPVYKFLHVKHTHLDGILCLVISIIYRAAIFYAFGWVVFTAEFLASIAAFCAPLIVNLYSHMPQLGYESYKVGDMSRNVPWVAYLSLGEGWHNNHHAFPSSARFGLKPNEFDFSWQVITILSALGLASNIRTADTSKKEAVEEVVVAK